MLGNLSIPVGPLSIPVWLTGLLVGVVLAAVLQRTVWSERREVWQLTNDALATAVIVGLLVWKLAPLVTRFPEIRELPSRLLYYPGGAVGVVAGGIAAAGAAGLTLWRRRSILRDIRVGASVLPVSAPLLLAAIGYLVTILVPLAEPEPVQMGEIAWLDGHALDVRADRPTVLTAWATWCGPCTAQMPEVERFYRDHGDSVNVIAVNLTGTERSVDDVAGYLESSDLTFPVALDQAGRLAARLEVRSTPTTIVLDRRGVERARHTGPVNEDWLARRVLPLGR